MERRNLIKNIFGKESGIIEEDVRNKILNYLKESAFIDYKKIGSENSEQENKMTRAEARNLIMPGIVAFLNKMSPEGGILVLGIEAKEKIPTDIIGVKDKIIMNDSSLRDWILNDISSIPFALEFPSIEIETVVVGGTKKIYFIEVHPIDLNVLYFNKLDDTAYVREMDTTNKLSLWDAVRIIDSKKTAKLYADLEPLISAKIENEFVCYKMKIVFMNQGAKPASNVTAMYLFDNNEKHKHEGIKVDFFETNNIKETSNINVCSKSFQQNFNQLFYPKRPTVIGNFNLRFPRETQTKLILEIDEQYGRTKREFYFSEAEFKKTSEHFSSY